MNPSSLIEDHLLPAVKANRFLWRFTDKQLSRCTFCVLDTSTRGRTISHLVTVYERPVRHRNLKASRYSTLVQFNPGITGH